jgi:hypothetical protein
MIVVTCRDGQVFEHPNGACAVVDWHKVKIYDSGLNHLGEYPPGTTVTYSCDEPQIERRIVAHQTDQSERMTLEALDLGWRPE